MTYFCLGEEKKQNKPAFSKTWLQLKVPIEFVDISSVWRQRKMFSQQISKPLFGAYIECFPWILKDLTMSFYLLSFENILDQFSCDWECNHQLRKQVNKHSAACRQNILNNTKIKFDNTQTSTVHGALWAFSSIFHRNGWLKGY